ncbi:MAG: hypothetical protein HC841_03460, partial [Verrucomicrobiae bacterium]|nr:hypothetical protein [Verrucomicrobiae bacterium]
MNLPRINWGPADSSQRRDDLGWFNNTQMFLGLVTAIGIAAHALSHA